MDTLQQFKEEFANEYETTKKFLNNYPEDKNDYAPHPKSMKLMPLAQHITEVFGWTPVMLSTEGLDFAEGERPKPFENRQQLQDELDKQYEATIAALDKATEEDLKPQWRLLYKGNTLASWKKYAAIQHALNQITHHRAQLGVYYRLNDIPVPGSYGPSADEQNF